MAELDVLHLASYSWLFLPSSAVLLIVADLPLSSHVPFRVLGYEIYRHLRILEIQPS